MTRICLAGVLAMLLTTPASAQSGDNPSRQLCLALTTAYVRDPGNVLGDEEHTDEFRRLLKDAALSSIEELRQFSHQLGLVPELVEQLVGLDDAGKSGGPAFQKEFSAFLGSSSPDKAGVVTSAVTLLQLNPELVRFLDRCVAAYPPRNLRVVVEPESYENFQVSVFGASGTAPRLSRIRQEPSGQGLFCYDSHVVTPAPPRLVLTCHKFAKSKVQVRVETSLGLTEAVVLPAQLPRSDCAAGDRASCSSYLKGRYPSCFGAHAKASCARGVPGCLQQRIDALAMKERSCHSRAEAALRACDSSTSRLEALTLEFCESVADDWSQP